MERTHFSSIEGVSLSIRPATADDSRPDGSAYGDGELVLVREDIEGNKTIVACVWRDDLYDHNGNRFAY